MAWERPHERRLTRRRFLGAAGALTAGAAGMAAAGCFGGGNGNRTPLTSPTPRPTDEPTMRPTTAPSGPAGGTLRFTGFVVGDGVADPHMTQSAPFYGLQSAVFSRLITYDSMARGTLVPDLAMSMPEQPDELTYVFRLNPEARWHDFEPLSGRAVTSEDVKFSIERQRDGDASTFLRKHHWTPVESIDATDPQTLTVTISAPLAAMTHFFADVTAFIVAPETAEGGSVPPELQVGSGPFAWVEWNEGQFASFAANREWYGGDARPYLNGMVIHDYRDPRLIEAELRTRQLDLAFVGRPQAESLKSAIPGLQEQTVGQSRFWGMRFATPTAPYSDSRVRKALSIALDRRQMLQRFFAGEGDLNPWISWPITRWSLPQSELQTLAGYRAGAAGRDQDLIEAVFLLDAYRNDGGTIPELRLVVVDQTEATLGMGTLIKEQLAEVGVEVTVDPLPLDTVIEGMFNGAYPWVAGPDNGWVDLDDWVFPYFHSQGTQNTFSLRDSQMDSLVEQQRVTLNEEERREIGFDIQRRLLESNVGVNLVSERIVALSWPYVKDFPLDVADGYQRRLASTWIDRDDPSYRGVR